MLTYLRPCLTPLAFVCAAALGVCPRALAAPVDTAAPRIEHEAVESAVRGRALTLRARITDESGVFDPALLYRVGRTGPFLRLPMAAIDGERDLYTATVPAEVVSGDLEYFLEAFDEQGNGPARFGAEEVPVLVRVLARAAPPPAATKAPLPQAPLAKNSAPAPGAPPGALSPAAPEDEGAPGLWLGVGLGGAAAVALAAASAGAAIWWLTRDDVPATVDVVLQGPLPVTAGGAP